VGQKKKSPKTGKTKLQKGKSPKSKNKSFIRPPSSWEEMFFIPSLEYSVLKAVGRRCLVKKTTS